MQPCHHNPVVVAELICRECFSWTTPVVLLEISFNGSQSGEWLLRQFPVSASTCISVLQGCLLPYHQGNKTDLARAGFGSEATPAFLISPLFTTYPLCEKYFQTYNVEPPSLLDVGLTSCGLNLKQNKPQNKANKKTPPKQKTNPKLSA